MMVLVWSTITFASLLLAAALLVAARPRPLVVSRSAADEWQWRSGVAALGHHIRGIADRPLDEHRDYVVGRSVVVGVIGALLDPALGLCAGAASQAVEVLGRSRRARAANEALDAGLAELIDLFAVALLGGHNVATAVARVTRWADGPFVEAFSWCQRQSDQGRPLSDALEELPARGYPQVRSLIAALVAHDRYGSAIANSLAQLAADNRAARRRQAETAARRLPVKLLFPLVICVLPAFLLLTVVPVIAETLSAFDGFVSPS